VPLCHRHASYVPTSPLTHTPHTQSTILLIAGIEIVGKAIKAPAHQIATNAGYDGSVVVHKILEEKNPNVGFNSATGKYCDLVKDGVVDPTKVVRSSLQAAAGVASLLTTLDCVIAEMPKKEGAAPMGGGGMGGGMGGMGGMGF
jgi:chaperonin GroEL